MTMRDKRPPRAAWKTQPLTEWEKERQLQSRGNTAAAEPSQAPPIEGNKPPPAGKRFGGPKPFPQGGKGRGKGRSGKGSQGFQGPMSSGITKRASGPVINPRLANPTGYVDGGYIQARGEREESTNVLENHGERANERQDRPFQGPNGNKPKGSRNNRRGKGPRPSEPRQPGQQRQSGQQGQQGQPGQGRAGGKPARQGAAPAGARERLQKVMARSGHGSRRNIEILIAQGHISINGQVAKLGDQVAPGDRVLLDNRPLRLKYGQDLPKVLLYHKQEGEICTRDDPEGRPTVFDKLPRVHGGRWVAVGRLDFNTSGLLVFTTDGELANNLMHPRFEVEREYAVRLLGELSAEQHQQLVNGVTVDDEPCKFEALEDRGGEGSNHWYHVILREGKNREVRKMFEAVGMAVSRLMRVRFGQIMLPPRLKRGMMMELPEEEVEQILSWAGVKKDEPETAEPGNVRAEGDEFDEFDEHLPNGNVISAPASAAAPGGQPRQGRPGGGKSRNRKRGRKPAPTP
jgi:23S rRNA pseudouridine2605 synthase